MNKYSLNVNHDHLLQKGTFLMQHICHYNVIFDSLHIEMHNRMATAYPRMPARYARRPGQAIAK
jgi:hypothetical protein